MDDSAPTAAQLLILVAFVQAVIDLWHNGEPWRGLYATAQAYDDSQYGGRWISWIWRLLMCPYCASHWVALVGTFLLPGMDGWARIPCALAAAHLSYVIDGLLPKYLRYDRRRTEQEDLLYGHPTDTGPTPTDPAQRSDLR